MTEVKKMIGRALTTTVVATTIAWSIGLSALIAPIAASAVASGTLVKASLPAVYYVGGDAKRYVFPNEKTYKTWYADFSGVVTITDAELASLPIGGNVTYRPGIKMVKITTDPKTYAVDAHGSLRWITSEAVATALYGASWNQMIQDVPDAFFTNYTIGADIASALDYSPSAVSAAATSINVDKSLSTSNGLLTGLTVSLSANQPVGGTLPAGATGVTMLKADVKNGTSAALTVDNLTVHRIGAGLPADFANVYVYLGNQRLTTGRTVNTTSNDSSFSGLNLALAAGETKTLFIVADLAAAPGANDQHALQLSDLKSGASSASGLPITGSTFNVSTAAAGTVTIDRSGSNPLSNVKAGGKSQKIAEFQLTIGAAEDANFTKIALFRGGAVSRQYVTNITLKQAGSTLATTTSYDSNDRATLVLATPLKIERGNTKTFEVYADIDAAARAGAAETILTYIDQNTDLLAVGATYGYGVRVIQGATGYDGTAAGRRSATQVEGGQLTITFNGPAATDVGTNGKDVELYNMTMAAASNLEIRNLRLQITAAAGTGAAIGVANGLIDTTGTAVANFTDIKVTDTATATVVAGPQDVLTTGVDATQALVFTEIINLTGGTSRTFKITADVANQALLAGNTIRVDLNAFAANDIRNLDNSTYIALTDIVPNTAINGNADSIRANTLVVSAASTPVAQNYIQGSQGVSLAGISLKAGDAGDVKLTSLQLQGQIDDVSAANTFVNGAETWPQAGTNTVASLVSIAKLWNGSTQIGETKSPSASTAANTGGLLTFDNLNLTVPKGQTVTLVLTGNLASSLAGLADDVRFEVVNAAAVSVTDANGNAVAATVTAPAAFPVVCPAMVVNAAGTVTIALAPDDSETEAGIVLAGGSNVVLGKYRFQAAREELKLTKVRIDTGAATGVSSISLYDGLTLVGGPVAPSGAGVALFTSVNFVIPKDGSKTLTVKGNLNTIAAGATSGARPTITLRDSDGATGTFEVRGTSSGSNTLLTNIGAAGVAAAGTVTIAAVGTSAGDTVTVNGTAFVEAVDWLVGATPTTAAASLAAAINASAALTGVVTATSALGVVTITAVQLGQNGNALTLVVTNVGANGDPTISGATLAGGAGDNSVAARVKVLRKTKPTVSLVALPSTVLTTGDQSVMRFTVSADAAENVSVKSLTVVMSKTANPGLAIDTDGTPLTAANSAIRRVGDAAVLAGSALLTPAAGTQCTTQAGTCTLTALFTNEEVIAAGTSRTYDVRITVGVGAGALATGDSISSRLLGDAAGAGQETALITGSGGAGDAGDGQVLLVGAGARNFVWSDNSAQAHSDTLNGPSSADWANGWYIKVLPTDTQTMYK